MTLCGAIPKYKTVKNSISTAGVGAVSGPILPIQFWADTDGIWSYVHMNANSKVTNTRMMERWRRFFKHVFLLINRLIYGELCSSFGSLPLLSLEILLVLISGLFWITHSKINQYIQMEYARLCGKFILFGCHDQVKVLAKNWLRIKTYIHFYHF